MNSNHIIKKIKKTIKLIINKIYNGKIKNMKIKKTKKSLNILKVK